MSRDTGVTTLVSFRKKAFFGVFGDFSKFSASHFRASSVVRCLHVQGMHGFSSLEIQSDVAKRQKRFEKKVATT